ncbi:MAG: Fe-S cluster assembly protein IscX [gamma proteobacterium symbiont of Taylorina sp.]|nr:Fe-S cluster assembly protein IscX [gamma proteobacterium symbiont of Taylorina sp.]
MGLRWTDIHEIVVELDELYPQVDPQFISFPDLMSWVLKLDDFEETEDHCGERILEAIQMAWIEDRE